MLVNVSSNRFFGCLTPTGQILRRITGRIDVILDAAAARTASQIIKFLKAAFSDSLFSSISGFFFVNKRQAVEARKKYPLGI